MFPHPSLIALNQRSGAGFPGLTPPFANVNLLIGFNGTNGATTFTDEGPSARTITTGGNAQITTSQLKFGSGSGAFDGTGDYLSVPDSPDWQFGPSGKSFTVEGWFRFLVKQDTQALIGQWDVAGLFTNCAWFFFITGGKLTFRKANGSSVFDTQAAFVPTLGSWYHLATSLDGSTGIIRIFVNGSMIAKGSLSGFSSNNSNAPLVIGQIGTNPSYQPSFCFNGNIDEIRISTFCCYNSDAGFTVPTAAFPRS